jgi:hypothetical protein
MDASDTLRNKKAKSIYLFIVENPSQYSATITTYEMRLLYTLGYNIVNKTTCDVAPR